MDHSNNISKKIAEWGTIFECQAGSKLAGTDTEDSDDDRLGVCIEPPEYTLGLKKFEQYIYNSKPEGEKSSKGDINLTIYSLRKWCSLALKGNPTALQLLYVPDSMTYISEEYYWKKLIVEHSYAFVSKKAGQAFLGYLIAQKQRLQGERGQKNVNRPELVEKYGYDTKFGSQALKLGLQGIEFLSTGKIQLPMSKENIDLILDVRYGRVNINDLLTIIGETEQELKFSIETSPLPEEPQYDFINRRLVRAYRGFYSEYANTWRS